MRQFDKRWLFFLTMVLLVGMTSSSALSERTRAASFVLQDPTTLPLCPASLWEHPIVAATLPPPDLNAPSTCRLPAVEHAYSADDLMSVSPGMAGLESSQAGNQYSYAIQTLNCSTNADCGSASVPGLTQMYVDFSAQEPMLMDGESFNNYHFYNRGHFGDPTRFITCPADSKYPNFQLRENISWGIGYGQFTEQLQNAIITEKFRTKPDGNVECVLRVTAARVMQPGAITFHVYRSASEWVTRVWLSQWVIADIATTNWGLSTNSEYGQEIVARDPTKKGKLIVPTNFGHHALVAGTGNTNLTPWTNFTLQLPLRGRSRTRSDDPFVTQDVFADDFTSIASTVNYPFR